MNAGYWISIALAVIAFAIFAYNGYRFRGDKRLLSADQELTEATWRMGSLMIVIVAGTTLYFTY